MPPIAGARTLCTRSSRKTLASSAPRAAASSTAELLIAAKQSAAIDHISDGRFILNVVTGWVQPEIEMFGQPMLSHEDRYACAEEWLAIIKRLWTEDDSFDHEGRFFKIKKGYLAPKPIQYPHPAIMNAGASELGRHYAVKNCDLVFTVIRTGGLEECTRHVQAYHELAREYGRDIKVWTLVNIVQGETEKEARDFYNYYVHQQGDWAAAKNMVEIFSLETNKRNVPPERMRPLQEAFIQGWGGLPVVGTREQVVDALATLSKAGLDGLLVAFPRYEEGMRDFPRQELSVAQAGGIAGFPVNKVHIGGSVMTNVTQAQFEFLRSIDTPTVCNLLEIVAPERRGFGYTVRHLHCPFPDLPPMVGFAKTVTMRAQDRVPLGEAGYMNKRLDYLDYVASQPQPGIAVIQDLDDIVGFGAFWGEVQTNIHKALGCLGTITNGSIRDIPQVAPGFQMLAGSIAPSHAFVHVVDFGANVNIHGMAVKSGDLIHADRHGAVVVPLNTIDGMKDAAPKLAAKEAQIIDAAKSGKGVEAIKAAMK